MWMQAESEVWRELVARGSLVLKKSQERLALASVCPDGGVSKVVALSLYHEPSYLSAWSYQGSEVLAVVLVVALR